MIAPGNRPAFHDVEPELDKLLTAPKDQRLALLSAVRARSPAMADELTSLLAAHDAVGPDADEASTGFLETPVDQPVVPRYRLDRRLARGGMGDVWSATRADGADGQRVAIKVLKRGLDSREAIVRFARERQILARIDHPHVARLLDGGTTTDGRPFVVMEFVEGEHITSFCVSRALPVRDRLALFLQAAAAVDGAHRHLVVHRDIKPSNVLVTTDGVVKLLDFGIAGMDSDDATHTETGWTRPLTPQYASPEQLLGAPITTASDVYQLGLLLHELLVDAPPYQVPPRDRQAMYRTICERDVPRPSSAFQRPALRGDLDAIVLCALARDPLARYASVQRLADDVRAHLTHQVVVARRDSRAHRWGRAVSRYRRVIVGTVATIALLAVGGVMYTTRISAERDRAVRAAARATESEAFIRRLFQEWNPASADQRTVSLDDQLAIATRRANQELSARPGLHASMLSLIGSLYTDGLRYARAESLITRAMSIERANPTTDMLDRAATQQRYGALLEATGRLSTADSAYREALALTQRAYGPRHAESRHLESQLARVAGLRDRWAESEAMLRRILADTGDGSFALKVVRSRAMTDLGYALFQQARYEDARRTLESSLIWQTRELGEGSLQVVNTVRALASVLRDQGHHEEAQRLYERAFRESVALFGTTHVRTNMASLLVALNLHRLGRMAEAESVATAGLAASAQLYGLPMTWDWRQQVAMILLDRGKLVAAEVELRQALVELRQLHPGGHQAASDLLYRLAFVTARLDRRDADSVYRAARAWRAGRSGVPHDFISDGVHFLAWAALAHGDRAEARALFTTSAQIYAGRLPAKHPYVRSTAEGIAATR